jgi:hypothetical protein
VTQIFIISGTSWTVPSDWNSSNNTIETIGGGGGGGAASNGKISSAGGGGAYSKISNLSLTASNSVTLQVGAGGSGGAGGNTGNPGGDGTDTWFNGASLAASSVGAKGGNGGNGNSLGSGVGGAASNSVGTTKYSGGNGGTPPNSNPATGGGGGGALGPNGAGGNGSHATTNSLSDNGGGGGGGSGGGSSAAGVTSNNGDNGGANFSTTQAGGAGSSSTATAGSAGTGDSNGASGGGGGAGLTPAGSASNGGNGGNGQEFDALHGSGGGGSGGGGGLIVITYTPAISATILAESRNAMEHQTVGRIDAFDAVEFGLSVPSDVAVPTEGRREIRCDCEIPIEASYAALRSSRIPLQWAGSLALWTDVLMPFEVAALLHGDTLGFVELSCLTLRNAQFRLEFLTIPGSEALLASESSSNGARFSVDGPLCLEWADPPSVMIVAPGRLLRSPGRIRVLAGSGQYSSAQR